MQVSLQGMWKADIGDGKSYSLQLPSSIQVQFTTDFRSVGTFAGQEGGMALLDAIYRYMNSDRFMPKQKMEMELFEIYKISDGKEPV